jgi:serine/threonine-protein kinase RsbW
MSMSEMRAVEALAEERSGVRSVRLRIPAKAEYIAVSRLALTGLAELSGMDEETLADLKLALTEAVSNSIRHGYDQAGGHVEIAYGLSATHLEVEVVDDGAGFDPERPPALDGAELAEGGLGIAIIRTIVDELEIRSQPGVRGSRLRFVKRIREQ